MYRLVIEPNLLNLLVDVQGKITNLTFENINTADGKIINLRRLKPIPTRGLKEFLYEINKMTI